MNRKAKLEKALAFDEPRIKWNASFRKGMQHEKDRLASLHEALITAVEALESIHLNCNGLAKRQAFLALSKIDKVLGEI